MPLKKPQPLTMDKIGDLVLLLLFILAIACLTMAIYTTIFSEKITLTKSKWECAATKDRVRLRPMGKSLMPMHTDECILYRRK